jgi:predicted Fe-Mo cluster-binding NifX family protein
MDTMKIAIPTDDGNSIVPHYCYAKGFYIASVHYGKIVHAEVKWNLLSEVLTSTDGLYYNLSDCNIVILKNGPVNMLKFLKEEAKKVVYTEQTVIAKALMGYLEKNESRNLIHHT